MQKKRNYCNTFFKLWGLVSLSKVMGRAGYYQLTSRYVSPCIILYHETYPYVLLIDLEQNLIEIQCLYNYYRGFTLVILPYLSAMRYNIHYHLCVDSWLCIAMVSLPEKHHNISKYREYRTSLSPFPDDILNIIQYSKNSKYNIYRLFSLKRNDSSLQTRQSIGGIIE